MAIDMTGEMVDVMLKTLIDDIRVCSSKMVRAEDAPFWRRMYARNLFAYVEGSSSMLRVVGTALICEGKDTSIPVTKLALLQDSQFIIERNGKLREDRQRQTTLSHIAFTLRTVADLLGVEKVFVDQQFGENGWNKFQQAIKIRDRLTHPKNHSDLEISLKELKQLVDAFQWYQAFASKLAKRLPGNPQPQFRLEVDDGLYYRPLKGKL